MMDRVKKNVVLSNNETLIPNVPFDQQPVIEAVRRLTSGCDPIYGELGTPRNNYSSFRLYADRLRIIDPKNVCCKISNIRAIPTGEGTVKILGDVEPFGPVVIASEDFETKYKFVTRGFVRGEDGVLDTIVTWDLKSAD